MGGHAGLDRCAIFIDAGHLLAEGGKTCCGTKRRADIVCDYPAVIEAVAEIVNVHCGLPILRTYWYDGARDAIPTLDHLTVAELPSVKLRLGRLTGGKQKGVDALIYRDLMVLSRERALSTAYLLAGDEDLREGVSAAQDAGVRVVVLGIKTRKRNQAPTLVREADEHIVLSRAQLAAYFSRAPVPPPTPPPPDPTIAAENSGRSFAETWIAAATPEDLQRLLGQAPVIPRELDAQLVRAGRQALGTKRDDPTDDQLVRAMRRGFWAAVRKAGRSPN